MENIFMLVFIFILGFIFGNAYMHYSMQSTDQSMPMPIPTKM